MTVLLVVLLSAYSFAGEQPSAAVKFIARIYREFSWEVVMMDDEPSIRVPTFGYQSAHVMAKYLDKELVALILAERACPGVNPKV
ncbi:MAG: hypothetical protein FWD67_11835 [Betaproteobacteria bacterium]|nr:hypothetical protein [Betaproteobacteria bacterium]